MADQVDGRRRPGLRAAGRHAGTGRRRDGGPGLLRPIDEPVHFVGQGAWGRLRIRIPGVLLRHRHTSIYDTCRRAGPGVPPRRLTGLRASPQNPHKSASAAAIPTKTSLHYGQRQQTPADRRGAIMAGYPVQRRRPPVITWEAARREARDSGTLSGTSAEEEQMTGKIMPLRERDTSTIQAAADALLSSLRYAIPNVRRGYTGVLDRPSSAMTAPGPWSPGTPGGNCTSCATPRPPIRRTRHSAAADHGQDPAPQPRTAMRYVRPGAGAVAEITALPGPPRRRGEAVSARLTGPRPAPHIR